MKKIYQKPGMEIIGFTSKESIMSVSDPTFGIHDNEVETGDVLSNEESAWENVW